MSFQPAAACGLRCAPPVRLVTLNRKMMINTKYQEIDPILYPWAEKNKLYVCTEYKDEEVRSISVVNEVADVFMIYVNAKSNHEERNILVGADLLDIGGKKHTFHRERRGFHFKATVDLAGLETLLDKALQLTREWASEIRRDHLKS
jgi:hypothetical protein